MTKYSFVEHRPGHKNSQNEDAPWCVVSHRDGKIISSHKTKEEAKQHLKDIAIHRKSTIIMELDVNSSFSVLKFAEKENTIRK